MGQSVTMPLIIEFNGLPGSGKTTIAEALKKELEEMGYCVSTSFFKRSYHRYGKLVILNPVYWGLIRTIIKYSSFFAEKKSFSMILRVVNFIRSYKGFVKSKRNEILMVDQGFIQGLISLAHQDSLPQISYLDDVLKKSKIDSNNLVCVNCNVNESVSNERITCRPMNGCRVETMGEIERINILKVQKDNLVFLRKRVVDVCPNVVCIDINSECNVKDNVVKIVEIITRAEN